MKLAIIGSRGIPCQYGGFERFAERLSAGLVRLGHEVIVYGLYDGNSPSHGYFKGVEYINLRTPSNIALQKPVLSLKSVFHSLIKRPDVVLFLGVSAAPFSIINRLWGSKTIINPDGLEWMRKKWGRLARSYLLFSEWLSTKTCHVVVADSMTLVDIYRKRYSIEAVYIPYGADIMYDVPFDALNRFGLEPENYILQSCRFEPENNVDLVIDAYLRAKVEIPLVIMGDAPSGSRYKEKLKSMARGKVHFPGFVFGPEYHQIVAHAGLYIHAHEVGGTNPSLLEAMAVGQAPLYLDVPFNREVAGDVGFPFRKDPEGLSSLIKSLVDRRDEVRSRAEMARSIISRRYSWDSVIRAYNDLIVSTTS